MIVISNFLVEGKHGKPILTDLFYKDDGSRKPLVIFCHGFKGFKDWGHFNYLGKRFCENGIIFVKFNFSHNGTTPDNPTEFTDLQSFGNNNYLIELDDLQSVLDHVTAMPEVKEQIDNERIGLLGHSRGGGISILKAGEEKKITRLVTWASVCDFINRNKKKTIETWERDGVVYAANSRTGQDMPMYYQFYETLVQNRERLDVLHAARSLEIPFLIIHGNNDEAVAATEAENLRKVAQHGELLIVDGGDHTFGVKHPFMEDQLPSNAELVVFRTIRFFLS